MTTETNCSLLSHALAKQIAQAVADGNRSKAMELALEVDRLCLSLHDHKLWAKSDAIAMRPSSASEGPWAAITTIASFLEYHIRHGAERAVIEAIDELLEIGEAKHPSREVIARMEEIKHTRKRMRDFLDDAVVFIRDVENLYGVSLADISRRKSLRGETR